jgi:pyruvate formate lyase activating enzyme
MGDAADNKGFNRRDFLRKGFGAAACAGFVLEAGLEGLCRFMSMSPDGSDSPFARPAFGQETKNAPFKEVKYYEKLEDNKVKCGICFRGCNLVESEIGTCRNRINNDGTLYSMVYGRPCSQQVDPIEKEPVFHMLPGSTIHCTGTAGCNFRCKFCQNWEISQRTVRELVNYDLTPAQVVERALNRKCKSVSFTYNEPTSFYEYMFDIVVAARDRKLGTIFHSNGALAAQPLKDILPLMSAITIDLKGFTDKFYRNTCSAKLAPVLESLETIRKAGKHLEIVNLVIPTLNDKPDDVKKMCAWIASTLGTDVPLHFNRFQPAYQLRKLPPTPVKTLETCYSIAKTAGIEYVYIGNCPGHKANSTYCPKCGVTVIERRHFEVKKKNLAEGKCGSCGHALPGVWQL